MREIEKDMKHNGLSSVTLKNTEISLQNLKSDIGIKFKNNLLPKLQAQFDLLPDTDVILCSSDILESTFGKYKNRLSENPMASVTNLILIIAAFSCDLTVGKVKETMEKIKMSDIQTWSKKEVGTSLFKQRNLLFST